MMNRVVYLLIAISCSLPAWAKIVEVECLYTSNELDLSNISLGSIAGQGLYAAFGNQILAMEQNDHTSLHSIELPDSTHVDEFFFNGDSFVFRQDSRVIWTNTGEKFNGMNFEDEYFKISFATDSSFYLIRPISKQIIEISMTQKIPLQIFSLEETPLASGKLGDGDVIVTNSCIYFYLDGDINLLHHHPIPIKTAVITNMGIFFGNEYDLWRITGIDTLEHVATINVADIFGSGSNMYVIDSSHNLYKFTLQ